MEVHEGTVRSLIRALARGDLATVEQCAVALASGGKVHAEDRDKEMWPRERLLLAWRCALPPYHRNPARKFFIERRTAEKRLVGCYVKIVTKSDLNIDEPSISGTILEDDGSGWKILVKLPSLVSGSSVRIPIYVPLDSIAICQININSIQLGIRDSAAEGTYQTEAKYLGLPDWEWFAWNQECGLAW